MSNDEDITIKILEAVMKMRRLDEGVASNEQICEILKKRKQQLEEITPEALAAGSRKANTTGAGHGDC